MFRLRLLAFAAALAFSAAATPAHAADPQLTVSVSSRYVFTGGTVKVKVTSSEPGRVLIAQSRRYVIETPGTGTCGWYDKYETDLFGLHSAYLLPDQGALVGPTTPLVVTLPATSLQFGAGKFPWESGDTWSGCRTRWTPYERLSAYWAPDGAPGGSYWAQAEARTGLQRLF